MKEADGKLVEFTKKQNDAQPTKPNGRWGFKVIFLVLFTPPLILIMLGLFCGLQFGSFNKRRFEEAIEKYKSDIEQHEFYQSISLPGLPFEDVGMEPFYQPYLYTLTWAEYLNATLCNPEDPTCASTLYDPCSVEALIDEPIDMMVRHQEYRRDSSLDAPMHYWIYFTDFVLGGRRSYDAAFNRLIQYHNRYPPANNASLQVVDCSNAKFLCHMWHVKPPTILHVTFRPHSHLKDAPAIHLAWMDKLVLDVRGTELPLEDKFNTNNFNAFPTPFEQFRRLTDNEDSYLELEELDDMSWQFRRWIDEVDERQTRAARTVKAIHNLMELAESSVWEHALIMIDIGSAIGFVVYFATEVVMRAINRPLSCLYTRVGGIIREFLMGSHRKRGLFTPCANQRLSFVYEMFGIDCQSGNLHEDMWNGMIGGFGGMGGDIMEQDHSESIDSDAGDIADFWEPAMELARSRWLSKIREKAEETLVTTS